MGDLNDDELDALFARLDAPEPPPEAPVEDPLDALILRLEAPEPPAVAPAWPEDEVVSPKTGEGRRWSRALPAAFGGVLLLAAAVFLTIRPPDEPRVRFRGGTADHVTLTLQLDGVHDGNSLRVVPGDQLSVGDSVYFRVASSQPTTVTLVVDGPGGREAVATTDATPDPSTVTSDQGYVAYVFDTAGTYTFRVDAEAAEAPAVVTLTAR